mmetsp:Transcript_1537/g.3399  ORF Transcript_1537/g.3399 Transcript_1537/m.3399 type:complete len:1056 (+) Transcript_1537:196-3363(+)
MSNNNRNNLPPTAAGPATVGGGAAAADAGAQAAPGMINPQQQQQQQQHLQQMYQQQQHAAWIGGAAAMVVPHQPVYHAAQYFQQQQQQRQQRQLPLPRVIPPPGGMPDHPPGTTPGYATTAGAAPANRNNTTNNRSTTRRTGSKPASSSASAAGATKSSKPSTSSLSATTAAVPEFLQDTQGVFSKRKRDPSLPKQRRKRYSKDEKKQIMDELYSNPTGLNGPPVRLADVAERFGLPEGTLRGWYDIDRRDKKRKGIDVPVVITGIKDLKEAEASGAGGAMSLSDSMNADEGDATGKTKQKRQRYSNETKIQVILALESRPDASLNDVAKEFGVAPGTVRGWREESEKIQQHATENRRIGAKANPSRDPLKRIWDSILRLYELNSRLPSRLQLDINVAVVRAIGRQARDDLLVANEASGQTLLSATEKLNMEKFKSSETWARKWARDHEIMSTKSKDNPPNDVQSRQTELQQLVASYPPDNVYTMTSTELYYRVLPQRTYVKRLSGDAAGVSTTIKHARTCKSLKSKDRLTLYVAANESGRDKLPIAVIGKYENPPCFQVDAQRKLPYLHQKQALSDARTFQRWWRTVFLPHVREHHPIIMNADRAQGASPAVGLATNPGSAAAASAATTTGTIGDTTIATNENKILLLIEASGPCKAELLRDPNGQVRVEEMVPSRGNSASIDGGVTEVSVGSHHPFDLDLSGTIKRRYRYRLLNELLGSFSERKDRRDVAEMAGYENSSRGLREGEFLHVGDAMRLLKNVWEGVASTSVKKAWELSNLRTRKNKSSTASKEQQDSRQNQLPKNEKRQTTREKKKVSKDLNSFFTRSLGEISQLASENRLEEEVTRLAQRFTLDTGALLDSKRIDAMLEDWVRLENNKDLQNLIVEEIREEMNIEYLTGLKHPIESVVPEYEETEDEESSSATSRSGKAQKGEKLDPEKALELAATIKSAAVKLFGSGNVLGDLAVTLDEATDKIFALLRKEQKETTTTTGGEEKGTISNSKSRAARNGKSSAMGTYPTMSVRDSSAETAAAAADETTDMPVFFDAEQDTFQQV